MPPEINSARIYAGAGSGPLFMAAAAWEGLAADLRASASSFDAVIAGLAAGPWSGPASVAMAGAAAPYVGWLSAAAGQAELSAGQATAAATAFEAALAATVHPAAVTANRVLLGALVATNILGQNTPAIAATEFDYVEMWAQDVGAMVGYHAGAAAVAETLTPFSVPPLDLAGLASQAGAQLTGMATSVSAALSPIAEGAVEGAGCGGCGAVGGGRVAGGCGAAGGAGRGVSGQYVDWADDAVGADGDYGQHGWVGRCGGCGVGCGGCADVCR